MRTVKSTVLRLLIGFVVLSTGSRLSAQSPYESSEDFARYAMKLREAALLKIEPQVFVPTTSRPSFFGFGNSRYPWKVNIVTTIFWVGELPTANNPVPNTRSAWDADWVINYGGYDDPDPTHRTRNYTPINFTPRQNPFYCALPYNDVSQGAFKPEASMVIPWFKEAYQKFGQSVCRNRWIEITHEGRTCYAQWSDCGPFRTDDWNYVFGPGVPEPNLNHGAGLDVSPAVRDYLGLSGMDVTSWRFVDYPDVPPGPWAIYGDNNDFVINAQKKTEHVVIRTDSESNVLAPSVSTQ